jgi:hypothetical protein
MKYRKPIYFINEKKTEHEKKLQQNEEKMF